MKLCFPVQENDGLESRVYGHFGSAPRFVVVDMATDSVAEINNGDMHHAHGACNPARALDGRNVNAVIVGGLGGGALMKLNMAGIAVYRATALTVKENIDLFKAGELLLFQPGHTCAGHSGGGCSH